MSAGFSAVDRCWICGGGTLSTLHGARFELSEYARQDPPLAEYSGERVDIVECRDCGFAQPSALPAQPSFFDRMYAQRWSDVWIAGEVGCGALISAPDTVPYAIWCAARHLDDLPEALWATAAPGGDIDTTCAIAGGVIAARTGVAALPPAWHTAREPLPPVVSEPEQERAFGPGV